MGSLCWGSTKASLIIQTREELSDKTQKMSKQALLVDHYPSSDSDSGVDDHLGWNPNIKKLHPLEECNQPTPIMYSVPIHLPEEKPLLGIPSKPDGSVSSTMWQKVYDLLPFMCILNAFGAVYRMLIPKSLANNPHSSQGGYTIATSSVPGFSNVIEEQGDYAQV